MKSNGCSKINLVLLGIVFLNFTNFLLAHGDSPSSTPVDPNIFRDIVSPTATVVIHISEATRNHWSVLGSPHADWQQWHIYGFLMEQLRSDGTPFNVILDADIEAGLLMDGNEPKYAIMFSLANDCISDAAAAQIKTFVAAGGHAFVGSTSWTRDENGDLRGDGGTVSGKHDWSLINVNADNWFSASYLPVNTIDDNADNEWLNAIDDLLPTSIWWEFPNVETISKVGIWQTTYIPPWSYRIQDYEIFVSTNGTDWTLVATNTGTDIPHDYQETSFTPVDANFVKITAYSSWEDQPYAPYDTSNWVGLDGFQAYDAEGEPLIDNSRIIKTDGYVDGIKFFDTNKNAIFDNDDWKIEGWEIGLYDDDGNLVATTWTNQDGHYIFEDIETGMYIVREVVPDGWIHTTPSEQTIDNTGVALVSSTQTVIMCPPPQQEDVDFGNWAPIARGPRGHSQGFWKNNVCKNDAGKTKGIQVSAAALVQFLIDISSEYGGDYSFLSDLDLGTGCDLLQSGKGPGIQDKAEVQITALLLSAEYFDYYTSSPDVYLPDIGQSSDYSGDMAGAIDYILGLYGAQNYATAKTLADALNNMSDEGYILIE